MKKIKYSSLTILFLSANGFYENYKYTRKNMLDNMGQICYENQLPVVACSAFFATELYLKLIHGFTYWEQNEKTKLNPENIASYPEGHNLYDLFKELDRDTQDLIFTHFPSDCSEKRFLNSLKEYEKGFMAWRYIFEYDKNMDINLCSIDFILKALYEVSSHYMKYKHISKEEWLENTPHTSATFKEVHNIPLTDIEKVLKEENN